MHPSFQLNTADYLIVATVVISGTVGLLRGLLREVIALITWIVAAFVAWHFAAVLEPHLGGLLRQDAVRPWAARLILFVLVLLLGHAVGAIVGYFVRLSLFTGIDRFLGLVFGLLRGVLIVGAAVIVCETVRLDTEAWWHESVLLPYGQDAAALLWSLGGSRFRHHEVSAANLVVR
ncbi:MAG TPA: CvpA family protein [Steroidobacteraceae bacterium]|jgi:membrane protein required for colicin V production|nr:CvpA family protein [Steroidobacteraceae bacterium]